MKDQPTLAMVAGEASGDQLGAKLIRDLRKMQPGTRFVGIGGGEMRAAGMECWWDSEELAVMGLFEVLQHFPRLLRIRRKLKRRLKDVWPDAFIGIDAPDFNLGLEQQLRSRGIRTAHYVSPTVWAWRPGRVRKIARACDLVICLFPFETDFYYRKNVAAVYAGHPLADEIPGRTDSAAARLELGLHERDRVVALLPGSRASEASRLSAPMVEAAALLAVQHPDLKFVAAIANQRTGAIFRDALSGGSSPEILLVEGRSRTVMEASEVVVCACGTATLEAMLINRPIVTAYMLSPATYLLAKTLRLVKTKHFALPNILAGTELVPELIQHQATGRRIAEETGHWLQNREARVALDAQFCELRRQLAGDGTDRAANAIVRLLRRSA